MVRHTWTLGAVALASGMTVIQPSVADENGRPPVRVRAGQSVTMRQG